MIEHVTIIYETIDGKMFNDIDEAYSHEHELIYKKSGFRFYNEDRKLIRSVEKSYNDASYFTIDHSKIQENKQFINMAVLYYGWGFPHDVLENTDVRRYKYDEEKYRWKPLLNKKKSHATNTELKEETK